MKALVTGGAGFIGSHLVDILVEFGYQVRVLDNLSTGNMDHLAGNKNNIEFILGDIRSQDDLKRALAGEIDLVFHLAAHISVADSMKNPDVCFDINVHGTNLLLQTAAEMKVKKVVISSSAAVYGEQVALPISEDAALMPLSPYGASKQMDEILASLYSRSFNLPVVCLRYFNVYGPRQNPNSPYAAVIPIIMQKAITGEQITVYGDGNQTRDFVFVKDIARANLLAAKSDAANGSAINICSGEPTTINQLINSIRQLIPDSNKPKYKNARLGDIYDSYGDPSLARKLLDFSITEDLKTGLKQTLVWMRN
jgi:UDP-glucose 4-epimerase